MKGVLVASVIAAVLVSAPAPAQTSVQTYTTTLRGSSEAPGPGDPDGFGFAVVEISENNVSYKLLTHNISPPTLAHIHRGALGAPGPVVVDFTPTFTNGLASGTVTGDPTVLDELRANPTNFYVNVHTASFPGGAVRGQLGLPLGSNVYFLPTVVKSAGLNGTQFISNLTIFNPGSTAATVQLDFFRRSNGGLTGATATQTITVPAGQSVELNDLAVLFNQTGTVVGALRITSTQPLLISHRVLNDQRAFDNGTSSLVVPAQSIVTAISSGFLGPLSSADDADILNGHGFRTNIGWFNPNLTPVTVTFTAQRANGSVLGTKAINVPGLSQDQVAVTSLFDDVARSALASGDYIVRYTVQGGGLFVYATIVDNKTGDGVFIAGTGAPTTP